jgi:hypothetical protein
LVFLLNEKRNTKRNIPRRFPKTGKRKIQRPHKDLHRRVKEGIKSKSTRRRIRDQTSIFSSKQEAVIGASGNNHTKNSKTRKIRLLMDKRKNITLCWVPGHAVITGIEEADEEAKRALEESIPEDKKYPPEDLSGWIKTEMAGREK